MDAADANQGADGLGVVEVADRGRFELRRRGDMVAFASYRERDGSAVVPHVETLEPHRGQGNAKRLMDGIIGILRADGRTIVPLCPFAAAYMRDHPELDGLLG